MSNQKFQKGDLVQIAKDLGPSMSHFTNDSKAIVLYSYNDKYGGGDTKSYALELEHEGFTAWYYENQLTLIEKNREDLLTIWKKAADIKAKKEADIDWIFSHGEEILKSASGSTVETLKNNLGYEHVDLWGSHGEGIVYHDNAMQILLAAKPFLETNDKEGWLEFCERHKEEKTNNANNGEPKGEEE